MLTLTWLWPLLAAICAALTIYYLARILLRPGTFGAQDLTAYVLTGSDVVVESVPVGSTQHKTRLAFGRFGLNVVGQETLAVLSARITLALISALAIYLFGFPLTAALAGAGVGWLAVDVVIAAVWRSQQFAIERELPTFLAGLAITIQAVPNMRQAVEDVLETLAEKGPLRAWLAHLLVRLQAEGRGLFDELLAEAQTISPALGLAVFELKRLAETGGVGYGEAFVMAADSLGTVLEARAVAAAKADNARGSTWIVLGSMLFTLLVLVRSPNFQQSLAEPIIQLLYLVLAGVVAFGMKLMTDIVNDAMA